MKDFYWLNKDSRLFLQRGYLGEDQTAEQRIRQIALRAENILEIKGFADKFEGYMAKGYYSLSTPVWTNFGKKCGLPVSCFNSYIPDSIVGMKTKDGEVGIMSKHGGGTSGYFGDVRARGAAVSNGYEADGPTRYMEMFDKTTEVISQGSARRGSFAAYLPVEHPDIMEFLQIREDGNAIQSMSIGVTITDKWMKEVIEGDEDKRDIWARIIKKRFETGYPYIFFTDTANRGKPQVYKDLRRKILSSNLCSEIFLPSTEDESFVCVLSSLNLLHWEELKETDAIETMIYFLDAVNTEFVEKTANLKFMEAPHEFAKNHRALGMGVLGWHSLLQSRMVSFESLEAKMLNTEIFKEIEQKTTQANKDLAKKYGEAPILKGYGLRNTTTTAIAPTTSSSFILGQVSQGIEPLNGNYFVKKLAKGSFTYKNPYLRKILTRYQKNDNETWKSILTRGGSVQHLDFLTEEERSVFKTFGEISQKEIIIQAAQRQKFIDQGQSLNIMIPPKTPPKQASDLLIEGWKTGIKSFYYQRSANPAQELSRDIMNCSNCEG